MAWNPEANDVFLQALETPSRLARAAYLDQRCGENAELRAQVESLLEASERAGSFLDSPAPAMGATVDESIRETPGAVIGPYKLLQQIGEGGMGTVFMAEQMHPVQRKVALKVIKPGMDSRQVIARFEAERQALAVMDHVNIARVFDGGTTENGRPYFVMELVHGVPITKYCDDNQLTPRERLELFVPVCQAIQHAHQKGIIHRDIKPSNVMVTLYDGKPVPKVIDFGVAKATEQQLTERTLFTQYGTLVGTPQYMSPEQAEMSALGVDTRSDIFSLGVLLYELLTGSTPLCHKRLREAAYGEVLRMIKEEEPQKPSTRLSDSGEALASISANRQTEPAKLTKLVKGELDWIVMKTLEKDRNRRYETVKDFAADVQRYLSDEPVQACPPTRLYRFRKFTRRNKVRLTLAALAGLMLLVTLVMLVVSNRIITHERDLTAAALKQEQTSLQAKDEALTAAEVQRNRALLNFNRASQAIHSMLADVAKTQLTRDAKMEMLQRALTLFEGFLDPDGTDLNSREETAYAYQQLSLVHHSLGQSAAAEEMGRQALRHYEQLTTDFPASPAYWSGLANAHTFLFTRLTRSPDRLPEAEQHLRRAIGYWNKLRGEDATNPTYRNMLAECSGDLGYLLWSAFRRSDEAEQLLRQSVGTREQLVADFPSEPHYQQALASHYVSLGVVLRSMDRLPDAELALRAVLKTLDGLSGKPKSGENRPTLARALGHLEDVLRKSGRLDEADALKRRGEGLHEGLVADYPLNPEWLQRLAAEISGRGSVLEAKGQREEAEQAFRRALAMQEKLVAEFPQHPDVRGLANTLFRLANVLAARGNGPEAAKLYRRLLQLTPDSLQAGNNLAWYLATCPDPQFRDANRAVELATKAVEIAPLQGTFWNTVGVARYRCGKWDDAIAALTKSRELLKHRGDGSNRFFLAMARWQRGDKEQARRDYEQAVYWMEKDQSQGEELGRFRREAAELLGIPEQGKPQPVPKPEEKKSPSKP